MSQYCSIYTSCTILNASKRMKIMTLLRFQVKIVKMNNCDAFGGFCIKVSELLIRNCKYDQDSGGDGYKTWSQWSMSWYPLALTSQSPIQLVILHRPGYFYAVSPFTRMICAWFHRISTFPPRTDFYGNISTSAGIIWSVSSVSPLWGKLEKRVKSWCCHLERDKWHIVDDEVESQTSERGKYAAFWGMTMSQYDTLVLY